MLEYCEVLSLAKYCLLCSIDLKMVQQAKKADNNIRTMKLVYTSEASPNTDIHVSVFGVTIYIRFSGETVAGMPFLRIGAMGTEGLIPACVCMLQHNAGRYRSCQDKLTSLAKEREVYRLS